MSSLQWSQALSSIAEEEEKYINKQEKNDSEKVNVDSDLEYEEENEETEDEGEQEVNSNSTIDSVSKLEENLTINTMTDRDIKSEWRANMFKFFANGKPRTLESDVRFKILNVFFYLHTFDFLSLPNLSVIKIKTKSYQAKIKSRVNKFLTSFDVQNFVISERATLLELFVRMLTELPRCKLENFGNCKEKCDYLYSFFDQTTLEYFNKIDTLKSSTSTREILHIKCILYDMHMN